MHERRTARWLHTQGVAKRAAELAVTVPPADRPVLIAAAWLHDIGYASAIQVTGFHPVDGGLYLRSERWDDRVAALVAHHSGARFVHMERGFAALLADFTFEDSAVSDALTYADQTVGPNARARVDRVQYLVAVADRVELRLAESRRQASATSSTSFSQRYNYVRH